MKRFMFISCHALSLTLSGCSSFKKITGQTTDTVLPGNREEVISPDQMTAKDPIVAGQGQTLNQDQIITEPTFPCNPKKQLCPPATKTLQ